METLFTIAWNSHYGLRQEFITPHSPEQNGMVERVIRTLKTNACTAIASRPCSTPVG
ncbi:transposase [Peristeroidobacter soli]|uniref:transposase n=1 Tax=Peristeroidobacter soli TaxID=2497877 RepID=UPI001FE3D131|nr:transposase [Peristeroidobacter soli]